MATRNIVLIIGNGFDLDLGLKTSYKDFWESDFCPKDYPAPLIYHLGKKWDDSLDAIKWYDLENALFDYYSNLKEPTKGEDCLTNEELQCFQSFRPYLWLNGQYTSHHILELIANLVDKGALTCKERPGFDIPSIDYNDYKEDCFQSPIWRDEKALSLIKKGLCDYLKQYSSNNAPYVESTAFQVVISLMNNQGYNINVYSFNYTNLPFESEGSNKGRFHFVHGNCLDGKVIVGTRDADYVKEYCFLQKAFDKHFSPPPIVDDLASADEVIIFGHSLGINDRQYFKPFFTEQSRFDRTKRKKITIITKDDSSEVEIKMALQQLTNNQLSVLMSKNDVTFIKTEMEPEDQNELKKFFLSHRIKGTTPKDIIQKIVEHKKMLKDS